MFVPGLVFLYHDHRVQRGRPRCIAAPFKRPRPWRSPCAGQPFFLSYAAPSPRPWPSPFPGQTMISLARSLGCRILDQPRAQPWASSAAPRTVPPWAFTLLAQLNSGMEPFRTIRLWKVEQPFRNSVVHTSVICNFTLEDHGGYTTDIWN